MIRGIYCTLANEVRLKLLHRTYGSQALQGAWTASDRWLVERTFKGNTLLLGVESDLQTRRAIEKAMRGDLRITVTPGGLFRERVDELVDFGIAVSDIAVGPDFGVFWTMASGFSLEFRDALSQDRSLQGPLSAYLHEADILHGDGPSVVLYRNFFDDETCVRFRHALWEEVARGLSTEHGISLIERSHVEFDGETYDLSSSFRLDADPAT